MATNLIGKLVFMLGIVSFTTAPSLQSPARLAIYYGYPSLVNGSSGNIDRAVATFADYQVIVFGDGLEFADLNPRRRPAGVGPDEHRRTRMIVERLRRHTPAVEIYGYVDLGNSQSLSIIEIGERVRLWAALGATGIFLDEAGYDFGVTRERQNRVIDMIHARGLSAFVNAFNPDDVFSAAKVPLNSAGGGNPAGLPPRLDGRDAFLLESFQVRLGEIEPWAAWLSRTAAAADHRDRLKTRIFAVTTTTPAAEAQATSLFEYAWWSATVWGLDGFGWGEPDFSAASSQLPPRHRAVAATTIAGTRFTTGVVETADGIERSTDAGRVLLSRTARSGRFVHHR